MSHLSATNRTRQKVLGYPVDIVDEPLALSIIEDAWERGKGMHVVTLNAEMIVTAQQNSDLDRIIRHAHLIVPDGAGVVWAVKMNGQQEVSRLPGIELAAGTLARAAQSGKRVALIGGKPAVMDALLETLPKRYPGINIVAQHHGYFTVDEQEQIIDQIAEKDPQLLLVALGVPKQEYVIDQISSLMPHTVKIGVGGSFDVWTGQVKRAPALMRKLNLEWLYRLCKEPWRFNRIMTALPNFFFQVLQDTVMGGSKTDEEQKLSNPPKDRK